jgi:hypothetical protein
MLACDLCDRPVSDADREESVKLFMSTHGLIERKARALPATCPGCVGGPAARTMIAWFETDIIMWLMGWAAARGVNPRVGFKVEFEADAWSVVLGGRSARFSVEISPRALQARLDQLIRPTG